MSELQAPNATIMKAEFMHRSCPRTASSMLFVLRDHQDLAELVHVKWGMNFVKEFAKLATRARGGQGQPKVVDALFVFSVLQISLFFISFNNFETCIFRSPSIKLSVNLFKSSNCYYLQTCPRYS